MSHQNAAFNAFGDLFFRRKNPVVCLRYPRIKTCTAAAAIRVVCTAANVHTAYLACLVALPVSAAPCALGFDGHYQVPDHMDPTRPLDLQQPCERERLQLLFLHARAPLDLLVCLSWWAAQSRCKFGVEKL